MKVYMRPVEMLAWVNEEGSHPLKFRLNDEVIKVEQVLSSIQEKLAGNLMVVCKCQSEMNGELKPFELKFEIHVCKWFLFKI